MVDFVGSRGEEFVLRGSKKSGCMYVVVEESCKVVRSIVAESWVGREENTKGEHEEDECQQTTGEKRGIFTAEGKNTWRAKKLPYAGM
jgi:hypothetical protein